MRKNTIRKALCVLTIMATFSSFAFADTKTEQVTKEYTFTTSSTDYQYKDNKTIKVDNEKYEAVDVKYELIKKYPNTVKKTFENLLEKKVKEKITIDGVEYSLDNAEYKSDDVTQDVTYNNYDTKPNIPATKDIETVRSGKQMVVPAELTNTTESVTPDYVKTFTAPARFYGKSDVIFYVVNGKKIPNNESTPVFDGYQTDILNYLNLNTSLYKITAAKWVSGYHNVGGESVRDAVYTGVRKSNNYVATYTGKVYNAEATYISGNDGETSYEVKAIVQYEKAGLSLGQILAIIGGGIGVLALAAAIILFILGKKKNNNEETK